MRTGVVRWMQRLGTGLFLVAYLAAGLNGLLSHLHAPAVGAGPSALASSGPPPLPVQKPVLVFRRYLPATVGSADLVTPAVCAEQPRLPDLASWLAPAEGPTAADPLHACLRTAPRGPPARLS